MIIFIAAIIDMRNLAVQANLGPLMIGFAVAAIGMSFGANAGYAINPARDFGPRVFAWLAGWGEVAMPGTITGVPGAFSWYFWVPIVGPLIGGVIGVLLYDWFIGDILHARRALADQEELAARKELAPRPSEPGPATQEPHPVSQASDAERKARSTDRRKH